MKHYELLKKTVLTFVHPDSRSQIENVFKKFEGDEMASICSGMEQVQIFTRHENQMVAGAALTGMVLGVLLTKACDKKEVRNMLQGFLDEKAPENVVDFNQLRKDRQHGRKH